MITTAQQLTRALLALTARGITPPCGDPTRRHNLWMSEFPGDRERSPPPSAFPARCSRTALMLPKPTTKGSVSGLA